MLFSFALIFIMGMFMGWFFEKLKLPGLLGMLLTGIVIGPYSLDFIDKGLLNISSEIRQIALIIILTRAGLGLKLNELKKAGISSFLLCFVPAVFEIGGCMLTAPKILGLSITEGAVLGAVLAAVSPAVIVPRMLKLIEEKYGTDKSIPQMIMAGASADDVFVIVIFSVFSALAAGEDISALSIFQIPLSIITGIISGLVIGTVLSAAFKKTYIRNSVKTIIVLSISFILITIEDNIYGFSGLIAIMAMGCGINGKNPKAAKELSKKYSKLWIGAEVMLFVLVGAAVNIRYAISLGPLAVITVFSALVFRMTGVFVCIIKTGLNFKERLFCMGAYCPKATVQAAIGAVPLSMGLACGNTVLCAAVTAIIFTAPLGALFIDSSYKSLLAKAEHKI